MWVGNIQVTKVSGSDPCGEFRIGGRGQVKNAIHYGGSGQPMSANDIMELIFHITKRHQPSHFINNSVGFKPSVDG